MEKEEFVPSESGISSVGLMVRQAYCLGMRRQGKRGYGLYKIPQFDGGTSQSGRKYKANVWDKIAMILCQNKLDAEEYVEYYFNSQRSVESPNQLLSASVLDRFKQIIMGAERPTIWEFELNKLLTEITVKSLTIEDATEAIRYVLLDDTNYVSPLVKYSFGHQRGMDFIVDELENKAFKQYIRRRFFYERYYSQYIPENLRKRALNEEPGAKH